MSASPVLLMVEDSDEDVYFFRRALLKTGIQVPLHVVSDGDEAVRYLSGQTPYADRARFPLPSLVLLDLKMPKKSGLEVLEWARQAPDLGSIPVLVYTSSSEPTDVGRAYGLGARLYILKPMQFERLREFVTAIGDYWTDVTRGPESFLAPFSIPRPE